MTSDQQSPEQDPTPSELGVFWAELKRRKVMRVAITYAVVAWLIIQVANATFGEFGIPLWAYRFVVLCVILGFPIAVILAWAFELTPDGIKTTKKAVAERGDAPVSEIQQRKRNWFSVIFAAAVPTVIFGALALFFYVQLGSDGDTKNAEKSIAMLPLTNMSPDPGNAFFADGVHEDVLTNLSKINDLLVIGRTSTLQYRDTTKTLRQIGDELGVRYLVEGSVRRAGDQVLVTVQLIDSETGGHLWAENYDRKLVDTFAIQALIAKEIAGQLKAIISPEEVQKLEYRPTENQEAYDSYARARSLSSFTDRQEILALLENAVTLDPQFAEAWAMMARECIFYWWTDLSFDTPKLLKQANDAILEAERFGSGLPDIPWAKSRIAWAENENVEETIQLLLDALVIDPSFLPALKDLGQRYSEIGRWPEAQYHLESILRSDPLDEGTNVRLWRVFLYQKMWNKARSIVEKNLERSENDDWWLMRLASLNYLETSDKEAYMIALSAIPAVVEDPIHELQESLIRRDYRGAINLLEEYNSLEKSRRNLFLIWNYSSPVQLRSLNLVAALLHFADGEHGKKRDEAELAKAYMEDFIKRSPMANPDYWSNLAICFALIGDRKQMENAIATSRTRTGLTKWSFRKEAMTEMHFAIAHIVLGDHDKAIETLEAASRMDGSIFLSRELDLWFIFDRLRGNPRFDALLED